MLNFRPEFTLPLKFCFCSKLFFANWLWSGSHLSLMSCTLVSKLCGVIYCWNITRCGIFWRAHESSSPLSQETPATILISLSVPLQYKDLQPHSILQVRSWRGIVCDSSLHGEERKGGQIPFPPTWGCVYICIATQFFQISVITPLHCRTFLGISMVTKLCQQGIKIFS